DGAAVVDRTARKLREVREDLFARARRDDEGQHRARQRRRVALEAARDAVAAEERGRVPAVVRAEDPRADEEEIGHALRSAPTLPKVAAPRIATSAGSS